MKTGIGIYVKNSVDAVELYKKAFNLELGYFVKNPDGTYYHSELCKNGQEIFSVVESNNNANEENRVQINVELDNETEVKRVFQLLSEGGKVDIPLGPLPWSPCAASFHDRFGVWWYISANSHYPSEDCKFF